MTYNHVVEGMLALTGYYAWHKICVDRGILPGMQELVRRIGDDERRHMAWGTFTCRRHVAADDANWAVFETRMNELIPLALRITEDCFALYGDQMPFDLSVDEFMQYAADKGMRRFGTICSARGRRSAKSTSTTRRCSWRTPSPTRTSGPWPALVAMQARRSGRHHQAPTQTVLALQNSRIPRAPAPGRSLTA